MGKSEVMLDHDIESLRAPGKDGIRNTFSVLFTIITAFAQNYPLAYQRPASETFQHVNTPYRVDRVWGKREKPQGI